MARTRYHFGYPLAFLGASAVALIVAVLNYLPDLTPLSAAVTLTALPALALLARPNPAPLRSFWARLVARVPSPVPRTI